MIVNDNSEVSRRLLTEVAENPHVHGYRHVGNRTLAHLND
jgi:hypothetical protein